MTESIVLPEGFPSLVAAVIEDWGWDELPPKDSEIWDALLGPIFLGRDIRAAQASYVKKVLDPYLTQSEAKRARNNIWGEKVLRVIDAELGAIRDTPGEGFKRGILENVQRSIDSKGLVETLCTAFQFFEDYNVDVDKIKQIRDDRNKTIELADHATREIHNVGYIKAVLWLYNCGIAEDLAPPNSQNRRFLKECDPSFRDEGDEDRIIFAPLCQHMREVAKLVSGQLNKTITAKQAQLAAWYLETCRGLPGMERHRRRLTPKVLLDFLESCGWDVDDMGKRLDDVEQLGNLGEELRNFLK